MDICFKANKIHLKTGRLFLGSAYVYWNINWVLRQKVYIRIQIMQKNNVKEYASQHQGLLGEINLVNYAQRNEDIMQNEYSMSA